MDVSALKIDRSAPAARRAPRRSRWVGVLVVLGLLALVWFLLQRQILELADRLRLPEVRTLQVVKRSAVQAATVSGTSANGYIVARKRAALSADTPGRIVELNVQEGSVVKQGDVVARLFSDEYAASLRRTEADVRLAEAGQARAATEVTVAENQLASARAQLRSAEADLGQYQSAEGLALLEYERSKKLLESGVANQERLDRAQNALETARARLTWANAQIDAARRGITTAESQLEVARSGVREAEARVQSERAARELAQATLDKTAVRAPFDGIVVLKDAEVGEVVSPNVQGGSNARGSVVTMVDFASLEVQAEVPETNLAAVVIGAPAQLYLDARPDKAYRGRVDRIWPTANRTKATVEVRVAFEERDEALRPEMGVRIVFSGADAATTASEPVASEKAGSIVIPTEALVSVQGASHVFVLERDVARLRPIAHGEQRNGKVVVERGLVENEVIVLAPPESLRDGQRVRRKS